MRPLSLPEKYVIIIINYGIELQGLAYYGTHPFYFISTNTNDISLSKYLSCKKKNMNEVRNGLVRKEELSSQVLK